MNALDTVLLVISTTEGGMDIWCKACGHKESLQRALRADEACPVCNAGICKRRGAPPSPASHARHLFAALLSMRGVMFIGAVAIFASVPDWRARAIAAVMLTLGAIKLAMRAMKVERDIEFPELSSDELFDFSAIIPAIAFSLTFLITPWVLVMFGLDADDTKQKAMLGGAAFLVAFAPMALVMYLRTGTAFALFFFPQGLAAIASDVKGYVGLCMFAVPALAGVVVLDSLSLPFYYAPLVQLPRVALVLLTWGFCGLYVRSRAREFDVPCDDFDWTPHQRVFDMPVAAPTASRSRTPAPSSMRPASPFAPETQSQMAPAPHARHAPIEIDLSDSGPPPPIVRGSFIE